MAMQLLALSLLMWLNYKYWSIQTWLPAVELGHQLSHKIFHLQYFLPARCSGVMVAWNLWEWPINGWSNLRSISWEGAQAWPCLDDQQPETRYLRSETQYRKSQIRLTKKVNEMITKILCYTHRLGQLSSSRQRGFFQQRMGTDTETHSLTLGSVWWTFRRLGRKDFRNTEVEDTMRTKPWNQLSRAHGDHRDWSNNQRASMSLS